MRLLWQDPINDDESRHRSMQNNDYEEEKTTEKAEYDQQGGSKPMNHTAS